MKLTATILQSGKTAIGIEVPPRVVAALGSSKKPSVSVILNGYTYRSTVAVLGGKFMIPVSSEVRGAARVAGGDTLEVEVALDTAPRVLELPEDFALALASDAAANTFFAGLSYSNQRRHTLSIEAAKTPETRARRVAKAIEELRGGKRSLGSLERVWDGSSVQ